MVQIMGHAILLVKRKNLHKELQIFWEKGKTNDAKLFYEASPCEIPSYDSFKIYPRQNSFTENINSPIIFPSTTKTFKKRQ